MRPGIIQPKAKIFTICGPAKLESKLSIHEIQWWDRQYKSYRNSYPKKETMEGRKVPSYFEIQQDKLCWVSKPGNYCQWLKALASAFEVVLAFYWRVMHAWNWVVSASCYLLLEFWKSDNLLSFACLCHFQDKLIVFLLQ